MTDTPIGNWSDANQQRAEELLNLYPDKRSAVMPLLYIGSLEDGYCSDRVMQQVAVLTGMTAAQVQAVASFYTMYKRHEVGTYLISVCTSISCMLLDADAVLETIERETGTSDGETSASGLFTIEHVECLGACGGAPAVQVNYELVEGLRPEKAIGLCRWLRDAKPEVVLGDEMQELFGGQRSFPWGPAEQEGAVAAVPAFGPYGSAQDGR